MFRHLDLLLPNKGENGASSNWKVKAWGGISSGQGRSLTLLAVEGGAIRRKPCYRGDAGNLACHR
ncbi:hypothetical protein RGUI_0569 [Rhodovulum sp. P5]|nr:hypothetical protein RGUI_0569 [Rhodovulum sp. P5]